jgi:hypothetical protein
MAGREESRAKLAALAEVAAEVDWAEEVMAVVAMEEVFPEPETYKTQQQQQ